MTTEDAWRTIESVQTALGIVQELVATDGAGVSELADRLELAPSTVHAHLKTLEQERFVVQRGEQYHPAMQFLDIGGHVAVGREEYSLATQKVTKLANETGERAQFVVEEFGRGYYLSTDTGDQAVQMDARIGKQRYLHASSAGKAILAALSADRVDEIIDRWGLPETTGNTITERDKLAAELEAVRERGYAVNREESISGLRAIGVSVQDPDGRVVGALSVSGPSNRLHEDRLTSDLATLIRGVSNEMELTLQHP